VNLEQQPVEFGNVFSHEMRRIHLIAHIMPPPQGILLMTGHSEHGSKKTVVHRLFQKDKRWHHDQF